MASLTIETERLMLRPLAEFDVPRYAELLNNYRISENTARIPWPYLLDDARNFARLAAQRHDRNPFFVITIKALGLKGQGGVGIEMSSDPQKGEIGYWLAENLWGKGYGFEAAQAVCNYAFANAGYDALVAGYRLGNEGSRRILDRLGFRVVSHRLSMSRAIGCPVPIAQLEVSQNEWRVSLRTRGLRTF